MKKIRLYGCPKEMVDTYKELSKITGVEVSSLCDCDLDKTLEEAFVIDSTFEENKVFDEMFMMMQGFTTEDMLEFLNKLKELEVPYGGIKIMQTEHNKTWRLHDLFEEVKKEHELFQKSEVLKQVIISTSKVDLHSLDEKKQTVFKEQIMKSYMILQSPERTLEQVEENIHACLSLLKEIQ
ncbi:DUF3783 domain-containing protein [Anaerorhabdus furcosa]|uniref:DUF3783 domain-containing protein n=1 Tax=Anaerorhabdus furcosa TaxID=118967 RepID=A0A1T4JU63_9FIRM|nr:DUF3783 domain-containing protein [Anaerorhabdus furcosa]SJZ33740.1 protein of unknown function [Anaerorhabdus furcosa]